MVGKVKVVFCCHPVMLMRIFNVYIEHVPITTRIFTTLLLGRSRTPFQDVFSISVALSLGVVLRLSNITPGGSEARMAKKGHKAEMRLKKL